jgi:HD-like signal output (HDOD) protein
MSSTLAERTLERATAAMRSGPAAYLPEIVKLLGTLSANSVQVSVSELADVIQTDPVILAKVIGAANTYGYNPTGIPVTTVTQAVHVIGYERIRTQAMSLVLMKHANGPQSPDERQNAVAFALASKAS